MLFSNKLKRALEKEVQVVEGAPKCWREDLGVVGRVGGGGERTWELGLREEGGASLVEGRIDIRIRGMGVCLKGKSFVIFPRLGERRLRRKGRNCLGTHWQMQRGRGGQPDIKSILIA